ncbi:hypothetical protein PPYR_05956 [Photinus pyralis]|uniref:Uncharacterized protein n=1 Tax=Photinus pyralis TaxID=7054 RepID=A0A5N4ASC4_PHOPY|nr:hypothetical protein PPYR_05956 [Photinus pyralis]
MNHYQQPTTQSTMSLTILLLVAFASLANAGFLESVPAALRLSVSQPAPALSLVSPAITRTEYTPGSYSSSYRSDVITPRVKYTETPGVRITVPQPSIAIAPAVARVEHVLPAFERIAVPTVARVEPLIAAPAVAKFEHITPVERIEKIAPALQPLIASPAVARFEHLALPTAVERIEKVVAPLPTIARFEHVAAAPLLEARTITSLPTISKVEHFAPSIARVDRLTTAPLLSETLHRIATPAIAKTFALGTAAPLLRSELVAPAAFGYGIAGFGAREIALGHGVHYKSIL